jgi:hypothetical protein
MPKNRKSTFVSSARSTASKSSQKIAQLKKELKDLEKTLTPEMIEKVSAQVIAAQSNQLYKGIGETADNYLSKAVIVNPVSPEDTLQANVSVPSAAAIGPVSLVEKPYIYGYTSDYSGSAQFRLIFPFNSINSHFGHTGKIQCMVQNQIITQEDILPFVRAFWFKNPYESNRAYEIFVYKKYQEKYQYKLIAELDDYVFEYPEWHPLFGKFTIDNARTLIDNLRKVDEVIVASENLKKLLIDLGVNTPINVLPNMLPKAYYGTDVNMRYRLKDLVKPTILYNGTNYHYGRTNGDFDGPIKDFIVNNLDNYNFIFMGVGRRADGSLTLPDYLQQPAKEGRIKIMPHYAATEYPYALRQLRPDFVIAPLAECKFNEAKSDLRYLESAAAGAIFIGQVFSNGNSPYQFCRNTFETTEDIESTITRNLNKDQFNENLKIQYDDLGTRWLDDVNNLLNIVKIFGDGIHGVQVTPEHEQYNQFKSRLDSDGFFR